MVEFVSSTTIVGTVRLLRDAFAGSIVLVEGGTDAKLYASLFVEGDCQIICAWSKENVIGAIVELVQAHVAGVLGIVDADFSFLDGEFPDLPCLFRTDTHDLETMLMLSPAFERVLAEFGSPQKIEAYVNRYRTEIRQALVLAVLPLGHLRWVSIRMNLSLRFAGLEFHRFLPDKAPLTASIPRLVAAVKNHSQRHDLGTQALAAQMLALSLQGHDPWQVCCGHDVVVALALSLRRLLGTNDANSVAPDRLELSLRLAYQLEFFRATRLFSSLVGWAAATGFPLFPANA